MGRGSSKAGRSRNTGGGAAKKPVSRNTGGGAAKKPVITNINELKQWNNNSKGWLRSVMPGASKRDIEDTDLAFEIYTDGSGPEMKAGTGYKRETKLINDLIDSPNSPVYGKDSYRGIAFNQSDEGLITKAISSGRWKEKGFSSFSSSLSVAKDFGAFDDPVIGTKRKKIAVIITNKGHTKGMPIKHLSHYKSENEVLQSASTMKKGLKIVGHKVETRPNGQKVYHIDVDDSK